jgi:hypothetical protein
MSHLPHVLDYRKHLLNLGITCPEELNNFAQEPYINAILRAHFRHSSTLSLSDDEEEHVWEQLDRWNKVSPIKGAMIFETVKYRLNTLRKQLMETGRPPAPRAFAPDSTRDEVDNGAFQDEMFDTLVGYLVKELVGGHE